jgi:GDPmannose 4,6-dehydratase
VRDWSDARDIVSAVVLAMRAARPGDYVLASGEGRTVGELVEAAFAAAGIGDRIEASIRVDPAFVRPPEPIAPIGDPSRAEHELGWKRQISFEQMIGEMVEIDLAELRSG